MKKVSITLLSALMLFGQTNFAHVHQPAEKDTNTLDTLIPIEEEVEEPVRDFKIIQPETRMKLDGLKDVKEDLEPVIYDAIFNARPDFKL